MRISCIRYSKSTKQGVFPARVNWSVLCHIPTDATSTCGRLPGAVPGAVTSGHAGLLSDLRTCREAGTSKFRPLEWRSTNDFWGLMTDTTQLPGALTGITPRHTPRVSQRKWTPVALFPACPRTWDHHSDTCAQFLVSRPATCGNPKTHDDLKHLSWGEATAKPPPIQWYLIPYTKQSITWLRDTHSPQHKEGTIIRLQNPTLGTNLQANPFSTLWSCRRVYDKRAPDSIWHVTCAQNQLFSEWTNKRLFLTSSCE